MRMCSLASFSMLSMTGLRASMAVLGSCSMRMILVMAEVMVSYILRGRPNQLARIR